MLEKIQIVCYIIKIQTQVTHTSYFSIQMRNRSGVGCTGNYNKAALAREARQPHRVEEEHSFTCTCVGVLVGERLRALATADGTHSRNGAEGVPVNSLFIFFLLFRFFLFLLNFILFLLLFLPKKRINS